ncbi:polysaccharide biosynthesis C-terminal domain-containing protein [Draconibacterium sp.]|nr:polysaccharide biosynthesis C-terminal domain-containing protein [Draconibacterium sp.]
MARASKELIKGASGRLVLLVTGILIGFFMMPYLIHSLGEKNYGLWVVAGSIVSFYSLLDIGVLGSLQRFMMQAIYKNDREDINLTLSTNVFLTSIIGFLALIATISIILLAGRFVDDENLLGIFRIIIALLGMKAVFQFPLFSFYGVLMAKYKYHVISNIQLVSLILRTVLIVLFVESGFGLLGIAVVTFLVETASSFVIVWAAYREDKELKLSFRGFNREKFKEYFTFGKYAYLITASGKAEFSLPDILIASFINLIAVTQYTIGSTLVRYFHNIMQSIFGIMSSILNKYYVTNEHKKLLEAFLSITELSALLSYFIGCGLFLLGPEFIDIWVGENFQESHLVLQILVIGYIATSAQWANMQILMAMAKHKQQAYISIGGVMLNLLISISLIPTYGLYAVALGSSIPLLINSLILRPIYTCDQLKLKYRVYYKIQAKLAMLSLFVFGLIYPVKEYLVVDSFFKILIMGALLTSIYFLIYIRFLMSNNVDIYAKDNINGRLNGFYRIVKG